MFRTSPNLFRAAVLGLAAVGITTLVQAQSRAPEGMPWFFQDLPDPALQGAWDAHRAILGGNTAISLKHKNLMALAVASQIPCQYCIIAMTANAKKEGATQAEIREAVAVAAMLRFWSTVAQGNQVDMERFKKTFGVTN